MGCDIHIKIEKRVAAVGDTDYVWVDVPWTSSDKRTYKADRAPVGGFEVPDYFDGRNYNLFAILADVRQGTWGHNLPPIAEPRGIPEDFATVTTDYKDNYLGDHSFSFVTLRELIDYDWDAPYTYEAAVSKDIAKVMAKTGNPPSAWCASGTNCVPATWEVTRRHAVHEWPDLILPVLQQLGDPDDVRLVFGFDS